MNSSVSANGPPISSAVALVWARQPTVGCQRRVVRLQFGRRRLLECVIERTQAESLCSSGLDPKLTSGRASLRNGRVETRSPILITKMCALLGGVPLMLGTGIGSEIRQPLCYAIFGGLLVS